MIRRLTNSVIGLTLLHVLINSLGYLLVKVSLREFTPFSFAFWRFVFGLGGLLFLFRWRRVQLKIERSDYPRFLLLAMLAVPANQLLYLNGMRFTVPSHAALLYGTTAVFALGLAAILGYEKLQWLKLLAIILAVGGVALVVSENPTQLIGSEGLHGDLLIFASVLMWASYTVLAKPLVAKYGAVRSVLVCLITGSLIALPFLISPALRQDYSAVTWRGWTGTLYTGIMITSVSYTLWFALLKRIDPSQVAILTTPQPVVATALSVMLLGETIGPALILGGILVITGVFLMQSPALIRELKAMISEGNQT